ncbi:hypothetical protein GIB67_005587 [Kingdonia uniflora]|uniref:DUF3741 domain-containing protein n=1 Tax=Kingdonia uniflora TaxID=39325 RepID=A0A7J7MM85_9MAGN|nr:hypothetical protein GIB67_005587 [Kingdonia uniflora]
MPQSSLRSAVYRSLVPCDDPNGVVENKTIRKSKNRSKKIEQGIESQRVKKESTSLSSIFIKEGSNGVSSKGIREELLDIPPSFELLEVSRGAQKLNEMIDSWSRGISFDGQSNEIARDLLKGALDLQKSLSMLCKLQETSNYKQNQKLDQGNLERNGSNRFTEKNYPKAFQNQRLSIDGASRNCVEELRTVIRESLSRQNLLPVPLSDGKFDSVSDIPSTSSSQSSADWSVSSGAQHRKTSVIAKLMGLEEFPSAPIQISQKQFETEKILSPRRPIFEIERPNTKKSYFLDRNEDPKRRTLKEVIETMRLNGLLKSRNIDGFKLWSHFTPSHSKQRLDDESPPIVIMKPMCFTSNDTEGKFSRQSSRNEGAMHFTEKLRNAEVREEL